MHTVKSFTVYTRFWHENDECSQNENSLDLQQKSGDSFVSLITAPSTITQSDVVVEETSGIEIEKVFGGEKVGI